MYGEFREMINLQKKQEIILLHVRENYSRRKNCKTIRGLDRATVGKYIDEYEEKKREKLLQEDMEVDTGEELIQSIVEKPKYKIGTKKTKVNR
jgi:hypothetical protein